MILKKLIISIWKGDSTNCYIVCDENTKEVMVVDPAGDVDEIMKVVNILKGNLKYIYLTHCHGDHIGGAEELRNKTNSVIIIHSDDAEGLNDKNINLTKFIGIPELEIEADSRVIDNDLIYLGELEFKVIHTPGHTKGSSCLYCGSEKLLFSGDTLFRGTLGRTDLPTSEFKSIMDSITKKLMILPEDTIVYPGHGKSTMIGEEKNIYLDLKTRGY